MRQVLIKQGTAAVEDIPAPKVEPGTVLVQVHNSCISIGTEMSGLKASGQPLWKRAITNPDNVRKGLKMIADKGLTHTMDTVQGKLSAGQPTGYSAAGIIIEVGDGVEDLRAGDRVACAGAQCAHHAEIIRVPRNLVVPVPEGLDFTQASTVALGAIALQGVRRAQPTLGECFVVIGLGFLGQLTVQMLKANGCRVIVSDLDIDRVQFAEKLGADFGLGSDCGNQLEQVARLTDGIGADGVIITAATQSNEVVSTAFQMCRRKGRVVLVGDVGLDINRGDIYQKELDFFISTSYGPGRYDNRYEEAGFDYPVSYVRWTENRNMAEYMRLLAEQKVNIADMISESDIFEISRAGEAYEGLKNGRNNSLISLLSYPVVSKEANLVSKIIYSHAPFGKGKIKTAIIGAGGFALGMHLPNLQQLPKLYALQAVVDRIGHNAAGVAKQFGASYSTTDYREVLDDAAVDAVIITTRHNTHAKITLEALNAGKHVLVEKPLAITWEELQQIQEFYEKHSTSNSAPVLLTGFNRRFSPYAWKINEITKNRTNPMILNYRMNAGYIPLDHWVHTEEGAGRNIGEACHIYDLFTYLTGSRVVDIDTKSIRPATGYYSHRDNFIVTISFEDGSLANLTYTALGNGSFPKEHLEVYVDGKVMVLNDYKKLDIYGQQGKPLDNKIADKGHKKELGLFARAIKEGGDWPIPLWQQMQATEISFTVDELLRGNS